jgi:glutamate N-acetyltransferase/amino-acid N-acetyltransferase
MEFISGSITAPAGFKASGLHCGIRRNRAKKDLALIFAQKQCDAAAIYTRNKVKGAPILVTREHIKNGKARAFLCNSGNANTCNADGVEKANGMCDCVAKELGIKPEDIIIASTGVIGQEFMIEPVRSSASTLVKFLSDTGSEAAEEAIMTTDTRKKQTAVEFELGGKICRIGGIAKGSGMINPNMATMLCFITTDADIDSAMLHQTLAHEVEDTFNMVCVDGDTSTNDMVSILASGLAGNPRITHEGEDYETFSNALREVMAYLSQEVARDGEGATKLIVCEVVDAPDEKTAKAVAKSVISSSLFKAAMFGSDANWGRVLCAIGYAPVELDVNLIDVTFESIAGSIQVCHAGMGVDFSENDASSILMRNEVKVIISLGAGECSAKSWGCDLTYDYVKINGDYRT